LAQTGDAIFNGATGRTGPVSPHQGQSCSAPSALASSDSCEDEEHYNLRIRINKHFSGLAITKIIAEKEQLFKKKLAGLEKRKAAHKDKTKTEAQTKTEAKTGADRKGAGKNKPEGRK